MTDTPLAAALSRIAELFHQQTHHDVRFTFGLSPAIHKRLDEGEVADVVVIQPNFISDLISSGKIDAGQYAPVARVGIGLFARSDVHASDLSTISSFKEALLGADMLVFSNVAGSKYFCAGT